MKKLEVCSHKIRNDPVARHRRACPERGCGQEGVENFMVSTQGTGVHTLPQCHSEDEENLIVIRNTKRSQPDLTEPSMSFQLLTLQAADANTASFYIKDVSIHRLASSLGRS